MVKRKKRKLTDYSKEVRCQCDIVYQMIVKSHLTIRQIQETETSLTKHMIENRINLIKKYQPYRYRKIKKVLRYNKLYRFKRRAFWDKFDESLL